MNIKSALISIVLTSILTLPILGQDTKCDTTRSGMKHKHMSKMMGKSTVDATIEGFRMKVWIMTQKHHKKMMKEMEHGGMRMKDTSMTMNEDMKKMKHDRMGMDKAAREAMMAGTHCIMLDVTDAASGKEITNTSANVLIVSPSKKSSSVDLKPMMNHFGDGLTLDEKGKYQFTVIIKVDGVSKTKQFQYMVK